MRLDRAVAARGLARSRTHAQALIADGRVRVGGEVATRASLEVAEATEIGLDVLDPYVSRGAKKLLGALDVWGPQGLDVAGRRCLDAGASTGGFTQVLLERGAAHVLAIDVGHGQLAAPIAADERVTVRERVNVRDLPPPHSNETVDLVVADLSFISLTLAVAPLAAWLRPGGDALLLVKPQFEVGAARLDRGASGSKGVVRNPAARADAIVGVAAAAATVGLAVIDIATSRVSGADGNVEFFMWCRKSWQAGHGAPPSGARHPLGAMELRRTITREVGGNP